MQRLVKPYWIRTGPGGFAGTYSNIVGAFGFTDLSANLQAVADLLDVNGGNKRLNYWLIPADWPEPKGAIWKFVVPFEPAPTPCDPGKAERKTYRYRLGQGEDIYSVARAFGQPDGWVQLRQANFDDPGGFTKPARDCGACTLADFRPGKLIWIPANWPDPPKSSPLWARIVPVYDSPDQKEKGPAMRTHIVGPGETSGTIAKHYGISKDALFAANQGIRTYTDRYGHREFVPQQFGHGIRLVIPQIVVRRVPVAQQMVGWDSQMPGGMGSYLNYWFQRIDAALRVLAAPPSANATDHVQAVAYSLVTQAAYLTLLANWLRYSWASPVTMIAEITSHPGWNVGDATVPGVWYTQPWHANIAMQAAFKGLRDRLGLGIASQPPTSTGQVGGKAGDTCTPYGSEITDVKPYYYIVQSDDLSSFWKIPTKFNMPAKQGSHWLWQDLRNANLDWPGGFVDDGTLGDNGVVCVLNGLYAGAKLKVPANWLEPKSGVKTELIGGSTTGCATGQIQLGNQCYAMPPGVSYPVGGACPAGTTLFSGLCLPTGGYPPISGYGCIPGTTQNTTSGLCEIPGGGPGPSTSCPTGEVFVPGGVGCVGPAGIQPVSGSCPAPLVLDSTSGLCKPPGTSGVKTEEEKPTGVPTWLWILGGGAVALAVVAAVARSRRATAAAPPVPAKPASKPRSAPKPHSRSATARVPPGSKVSVSINPARGINDSDREEWVDNDEGLYDMWRRSRMSKRNFVRQHRAEIDQAIHAVTSGSHRAHYLKYGG